MGKLEKLVQIANERYDGHFTLMKFTNNWRCCFGTILDTMYAIKYMPEGKTMEEAIKKCILNDIDDVQIDKMVKEEFGLGGIGS